MADPQQRLRDRDVLWIALILAAFIAGLLVLAFVSTGTDFAGVD